MTGGGGAAQRRKSETDIPLSDSIIWLSREICTAAAAAVAAAAAAPQQQTVTGQQGFREVQTCTHYPIRFQEERKDFVSRSKSDDHVVFMF